MFALKIKMFVQLKGTVKILKCFKINSQTAIDKTTHKY